jgi:hypothetical protein
VGVTQAQSAAVSEVSFGHSTVILGFLRIPSSSPVLGVEDSQRVQWCAVGHHERAKCDHWSAVSGGALACTMEETSEDCITAIVVRRPCFHSWTQTLRHSVLLQSVTLKTSSQITPC